MTNKSPSINLLKKGEKSFIDKFIAWALTTGRLLVIITESVALFAFTYRFSLDRQIIDLHDRIKQKQAILKLLKGNEDKFINLQNRLSTISTYSNEASEVSQNLTNLVNLIPNRFTLNQISLSANSVNINANAQSVSALTTYITSLRNYPNIQFVSLDKVENKTSSATIALGISASFKKGK